MLVHGNTYDAKMWKIETLSFRRERWGRRSNTLRNLMLQCCVMQYCVAIFFQPKKIVLKLFPPPQALTQHVVLFYGNTSNANVNVSCLSGHHQLASELCLWMLLWQRQQNDHCWRRRTQDKQERSGQACPRERALGRQPKLRRSTPGWPGVLCQQHEKRSACCNLMNCKITII